MQDALTWPVVDEEVLQPLPPILRAVVKALGFGKASVFLQQHGGLPFSMPTRKDSKAGLSKQELARLRITLAPHLDAAGRCVLPKHDKLMQQVRNQDIIAKRGSASITDQARTYHLTTRQVINIRAMEHGKVQDGAAHLRRNLTLDKAELEALLLLVGRVAQTEQSPLYARIAQKLSRAKIKHVQAQQMQFDLF